MTAKRKPIELQNDHLRALLYAREVLGATWERDVTNAWRSGAYPENVRYVSALLQQVRNYHGPDAFKALPPLPKVEPRIVRHEAIRPYDMTPGLVVRYVHTDGSVQAFDDCVLTDVDMYGKQTCTLFRPFARFDRTLKVCGADHSYTYDVPLYLLCTRYVALRDGSTLVRVSSYASTVAETQPLPPKS